MIPFDLERAKKGVPFRTRAGNKAVLNAELLGGQPAPLVVDVWRLVPELGTGTMIDVPTKNGNIENYYLDGRHGTVHDSPLDLFMEY